MSDKSARAFVREYLARTCGVNFADLNPRPDQKTADFEMVDSGNRVLVAELKHFEDLPPSAETRWTIRSQQDGTRDGTCQ